MMRQFEHPQPNLFDEDEPSIELASAHIRLGTYHAGDRARRAVHCPAAVVRAV